jgi:hypothetical protein
MNLEDLQGRPRFFGLFLGDPGTGKTIQACSFPGVYVFDCDNRMRPVVNFHKGRKDINFDTYYRDYPKLAQKLEELLGRCPYDTIVMDSLTMLADMIILQSIRSAGKGDDKDRVGKKIGGVMVPSIEDFNMESGALTQVLDALRGIPANVILTAHVITTSETDLKTKRVKENRTLLTAGKKIAAKIPTAFDEIYSFYSQSDISGSGRDYFCATYNTGLDMGKTAHPMPDMINLTQSMTLIDDGKFLWPQIQHYFEKPVVAGIEDADMKPIFG